MKKFLHLKGDISGGLTAGVVALPLSLAFGIASGLGASAGLYGAIMLSFFASIFGGTKTQISGPTGPMTVVVASVALALENDISLIVTVFILTGVFQILFGILRVGKFVKFIPYPVISGFMNGVGIIIILLQIAPLLGSLAPSNTLSAILNIPTVFTHINLQSASLGALTLFIIYLTPKKVSSFIPSPLLALIVLTMLSLFLGLYVKTIGDIPSSLPSFVIPSLDVAKISLIVSYAAMLALLGSIDSLLTSLVADSITKTKHNSNRELIGQGFGNIMAGFFGGLVGAGATMRTVINIKTGATTRLSGVISSLFLLLVLIVLGGFVSKVPIAVLSGILIKVGFDILDYRLLKNLRNAPLHDLSVMLLVFGLTVFVDLIFAVGVGIIAASLLLVYRISKEANVELENEDEDELNSFKNGVRVITINGAFFFGSTSQIIERASNLMDLNVLVLDISKVPFIDLSAAYALEEMVLNQLEKEVVVYLIINQKQKSEKALNAVMRLVEKNIYTNKREALQKAIRENKILEEE